MSGLFNKKFASQQDIEQGQVPDHLSDQPTPNPQILPQQQPEPLISHPDEDQFIFETLPDNHFESDYPKDKNHHKTQEYHSINQSSQKKDRDRQDRYDREKRQDKNVSQKQSLKKQPYNQENKKKPQPQDDLQLRPPIAGSVPPVPIGYYPGMAPPISNPYTPQGYYPPYGSITPTQPGTRPPYGMYPQLHHQPPPGIYAPPPHQNMYPVPNPNIYQIPPPPIAYGSIQPMVQPIPPEMYHPQMMESLRNLNYQGKPYTYDQQRPYPENPAYNHQKSQKLYQNRDKQDQRHKNFKDKQSDNRYPEERQRSRDKKDRYDSETTKGQQKHKHHDRKSSHDHNTKERSKDQNFQNQRISAPKEPKKVKQDEDKLKLKVNINDQLSIIFANDQQAKEEFLLVLRDVIKYKLLKKEEEVQKFNGFDLARPTPVYSLNKDLIESNYSKALLKIENLLISLAQTDSKSEGHSSAVDKKDALILILASLQIEDLVSKVKEMRLKKKLLGERKMSDIKKILDELVKDPRKRIK